MADLEAAIGIEPMNRGFAVRSGPLSVSVMECHRPVFIDLFEEPGYSVILKIAPHPHKSPYSRNRPNASVNAFHDQPQAGRLLISDRYALRASLILPGVRENCILEITIHLEVESSFFVQLEESNITIAVIQRDMNVLKGTLDAGKIYA